MSLTTITTRLIRDAAVTTAKLAANAVTLGKLGALTTKGDVLTHDGSDHQRLGVGTDGQALIADSAEATGMKWGDAGVSDHGELTGLTDDDHTQYHNDTRGDARYYTQAQVDSALAGKADDPHTHVEADITDLDKYTQAEVDTALAGKADASHTHTLADVTDAGGLAAEDADGVVITSLNADLLDGQHASAFATAAHTHPLSDITDAGDLAAKDTAGTADIDDAAVTLAKLAALTTKGDVLGHNGTAHVRLPVGTDGQVLSADSGEAGGLKWIDMALSSRPYVQLSHNSNDTAVTNNVYNSIAWEAEDEDTHGFADLLTDDTIITIPAGLGGRYLLVCFTKWRIGKNSTDGSGNYFIRLYNQTTAEEMFVQSTYAESANPQPTLAALTTLAAGDEISVDLFPFTSGDTAYGLSRLIAFRLEE